MVANFVAGISPLLQGRNGYLPSIGQKDRVPGGYARKTKQKGNKEHKRKKWKLCTQGYTPEPCIQLVRT